jgi:hypothetical protein
MHTLTEIKMLPLFYGLRWLVIYFGEAIFKVQINFFFKLV